MFTEKLEYKDTYFNSSLFTEKIKYKDGIRTIANKNKHIALFDYQEWNKLLIQEEELVSQTNNLVRELEEVEEYKAKRIQHYKNYKVMAGKSLMQEILKKYYNNWKVLAENYVQQRKKLFDTKDN